MLLNRVRVIKSVHCDQYNVFVIICIIILSLGMCTIYNSSLSFLLPITYQTLLQHGKLGSRHDSLTKHKQKRVILDSCLLM